MDVATIFYILGGLLVVLALLTSFLGLRSERFPGSPRAVAAMLGGVAVIVVATGAFAIQVGAEELEHREEELAEVAEDEGDTETGSEGNNEADPGGEAGTDGRTLFVDTGCGNCHALADAGTSAQVGPSLDDALQNKPVDFVRTSIIDPNAQIAEGFSEGVMPDDYEQQLSPEELDVLVDYLAQVGGAEEN